MNEDNKNVPKDINQNEIEYVVHHLDLTKVKADASFNCRGIIAPIDVIDLAKDIEKEGLQNPILVQELKDDKEGFDFRIISGHRRFTAYKVLKKTTIPSFIRNELTEIQARVLNLNENLQREELDFMQEARALQHLKDLGVGREKAGDMLNRSGTWVQSRYYALELPTEIQEEIALGVLTQQDVRDLRRLPTKEAQFEAVRNIKNAISTGAKKPTVSNAAEKKLNKKRTRLRGEIFELQSKVYDSFDSNNIITRVLAWCAGEIDDADCQGAIKEFADEQGVSYTVPVYGEK